MSMWVRYAGDSYTYLLESVARDHGRAPAATPMTRYYSAAGTPPGTWLGRGLAGLADGRGLHVGSFVTPIQTERLFADGEDPATGSRLGCSPHVYPAGDPRRPVAGFDCTFTVPKSVSTLWALADAATREQIYACHRQAIADVVAVIERDVAKTRIGTNGAAQVDVRGVVAAAFDHWDTRDNDPNLHTHVVIANRAQGLDGRWRTLDSRAIHRAAVAMSERYDALLADHIAARLDLDWEYRERGAGRNPAYEVAVVPRDLVALFSRRSAAIDVETDRLVEAYVAAHGRRPDDPTVLQLRQQATLATRGPKIVHSLEDLTTQWHARAGQELGGDGAGWARDAARSPARVEREPVEASPAVVAEATAEVLAALSAKRSTWTRWNIDAAASRALKHHRFASADARDAAMATVVADVAERCVQLTPAPVAPTPSALQRADGSSAFRPHNAERYTSQQLLDAEARLLTAGRHRNAPALDPAAIGAVPDLYADQAAAVAAIATSGRVVDVLVGPAGSGKTRTLAALRTVWESRHGPGSVLGLAPSAAAADVLAQSLRIGCENTAKWLVEHDAEPDRLRRIDRARAALHAAPDDATARTLAAHIQGLTGEVERWRFHPGQLVILDEASLAGTLHLDRIVACAGEAGAKVVLVGDWAQLSAIDAGGAFGLLARDRGPGVPELGTARRFTHSWERDASTRLRLGDASCLDDYAAHDRLRAGDHPAMIDAAYTAWAADQRAGLRSLLIAGDHDTVHALNERARAELVVRGEVEHDGARLHDGLVAGVGDRVVTRRNDRHLVVGDGWVKNGDTWTVVDRHDGGLVVRREAGGPAVALTTDYVAEHVELGYATTAFRAQGATVDTAHAVITGPGMTREVLYVALTRARQANHTYVCTDAVPEPLHGFADPVMTGREVLAAVLSHVGAAVSAHEVRAEEHEAAASIRTLTAEYETLAHIADAPHWVAVLGESGLSPAEVRAIEDSPAFGALTTALRRADACGLPVGRALPALAERADVGALDLASVLHLRVERWTDTNLAAGRGRPPRLVGGLIPEPVRVSDPEIAAALSARERLIDQRATELVGRAVAARAGWLAALGPRPADPGERPRWDTRARTVAAYRDRYGITDPHDPLGPAVADDRQRTAARDLVATEIGVEPVDRSRAAAPAGVAPPTPEIERRTPVGR